MVTPMVRLKRFFAGGSALAVGLGLVAVASVSAAPPAAAATGDYKLTIVTRYCPDSPGNAYLNVRANRARNNIMETLKNLGPDTNYTNNMNPPVNPTKESAAPQDVCDPLTNFPVTLGDKISGKATLPVNGSNPPIPYLSKVGGVSGTYRSESSVPLLNSAGQPTGQTIEGPRRSISRTRRPNSRAGTRCG